MHVVTNRKRKTGPTQNVGPLTNGQPRDLKINTEFKPKLVFLHIQTVIRCLTDEATAGADPLALGRSRLIKQKG